MTLLSRYLVRHNLFLLFTVLLVGTGLYVLTDMFERLDHFLESGAGILMMLFYFLVKIPNIISLILPAVYMIALVVQLNFLDRSRELVALTAGGISPSVLVRFVLLYGLLWAGIQFAFGQVIGVAGERTAAQIWLEDVRGTSAEEANITKLWFTEKNKIIYIGQVFPLQGKGTEILVYSLDDSKINIVEIIKAKRFHIDANEGWVLEEGELLTPSTYTAASFDRHLLPVEQDIKAFQVMTNRSGVKPSQMSVFELDDAIKHLEQAGSNVESLRTAFHSKMSYACSIVIMGLFALTVSRLTPNIYKAVGLSLLIVFFYYGLNTLCSSMGEKGILTSWLGAWFANILFFISGTTWLLWPAIRSKLRGMD